MKFDSLLPRRFMVALGVCWSIPAQAAAPMLQACKAEIKKFGCDAKSETYAYECLNKHKEPYIKDKGFRAQCFKAYLAYEKSSGKGEKIDSHQVERLEHKN